MATKKRKATKGTTEARRCAVVVDAEGKRWSDSLVVIDALDALVGQVGLAQDQHTARCLAIAKWAINSAIEGRNKNLAKSVGELIGGKLEWKYAVMERIEIMQRVQRELRAAELREWLKQIDGNFARLTDKSLESAFARLDESPTHLVEVAARLTCDAGAFGFIGGSAKMLERARTSFNKARNQHKKNA